MAVLEPGFSMMDNPIRLRAHTRLTPANDSSGAKENRALAAACAARFSSRLVSLCDATWYFSRCKESECLQSNLQMPVRRQPSRFR